jgi:hypothetical protein
MLFEESGPLYSRLKRTACIYAVLERGHCVNSALSAAWNVPGDITRCSRDQISVSAHRNHFSDYEMLRWRVKVNALIADSRVLGE